MNKETIKKIELLRTKYPEVDELWSEYQKFFEDPAAMLYYQLSELTKVLVNDIEKIRDKKRTILSGDKEDKVFERIMVIYKESEKIFTALKLGRESVNPSMNNNNKKSEEEMIY